MPHISLKMIKGRTDEQKMRTARAIEAAVCKELSVDRKYISVTVEDYTPEEWQDTFKTEVKGKEPYLYVKPGYDPKDLLL